MVSASNAWFHPQSKCKSGSLYEGRGRAGKSGQGIPSPFATIIYKMISRSCEEGWWRFVRSPLGLRRESSRIPLERVISTLIIIIPSWVGRFCMIFDSCFSTLFLSFVLRGSGNLRVRRKYLSLPEFLFSLQQLYYA